VEGNEVKERIWLKATSSPYHTLTLSPIFSTYSDQELSLNSCD